MQNLILFQTVINCDGEFGCERQKNLKNKENLISWEDLWFYEMKIFLIENSSLKWKKKR